MRSMIYAVIVLGLLAGVAAAQEEVVSYAGTLERGGVPWDGPVQVRLRPSRGDAVEATVQAIAGRFLAEFRYRKTAADDTAPILLYVDVRTDAGEPWTELNPPLAVHPVLQAVGTRLVEDVRRAEQAEVHGAGSAARTEVPGGLDAPAIDALAIGEVRSNSRVTLRGNPSSDWVEFAPFLDAPDAGAGRSLRVPPGRGEVVTRAGNLPDARTHFCFLSAFILGPFDAQTSASCEIVVDAAGHRLQTTRTYHCEAICLRFAQGIAP